MWGWNPESFEAIGTVSAAFIALIAYFNSLRQKDKDRREVRRRLAEQVTLTCVRDSSRELQGGTDGIYTAMVLTLTNHGPYPIDRVTATFTARGSKSSESLEEITATDAPIRWIGGGSSSTGILKTAYSHYRFDGNKGRVDAGETVTFHYRAGMDSAICAAFVDNEGRSWRKYPAGALVEG